jgi:Predicted membrane protein
MLIVFPLGLLGMAVIFDIIRLIFGATGLASSSYHMIAAGVITGLLAAVFGFIDWLAIPSGTRAKRIGVWHAIGNVTIVVLFAISWWLRRGDPADPSTLAFVLGLVGLLLALVTSWLGGELVDRLGVGVYDNANVDAPSSLS